ncbi:Nramp family divalent metal transporter [Georgenia deserti]|uniref:Nramp family divalent metal transporter n=1 Tax=Georgenia deserti TaxID=2093781 RepID=A0ABW4L6N3_9MICO
MSERSNSSPSEVVASEIPSHQLPAVTYRDMPEAPSFWKIMGPGLVLLAGAVGSGEFVFWPLLASDIGLALLWAAFLGVFLQYFLNTEVQRYTLATGETAITGFARLWKPWGILFATLPIVGFLFPGIATSAMTVLTYATGWGDPVILTILGLLAIGIAFSISPVIYQTLEKFQFVVVGITLAFLAVAVVMATTLADWGEATRGLVSFGHIPAEVDVLVLFGAVVYAGSGGLGNLTVSNWIRDKNWGMGAHIPRVVSPITGAETSAPSLGHFFPQDEANLTRWNRWWKLAKREQFWLFLVLGTLSIVVLSVLAYSTVFGQDVPEGDLAFLLAEGQAFQDAVAPWFGTLFWVAGFCILFSTAVGNLDIAARVVGDSFKVGPLRESTFWSESKIYLTAIWLQVLFGVGILAAGLTAPVLLLSFSGLVGGLVIFFSSALIIKLNRKALPRTIRIGGFRLAMMILAALFYGAFAVYVVVDSVGSLIG